MIDVFCPPVPAVNMSPVVGLLRKGRKLSELFLMCSAVRDLSSLKLNPDWKIKSKMTTSLINKGDYVYDKSVTLMEKAHLRPLPQLIFYGAVHAVAVGGDLLDLKAFLSEYLGQLQALLVPHTLEVLHLGLRDPALPLLLLSCFLVLEDV